MISCLSPPALLAKKSVIVGHSSCSAVGHRQTFGEGPAPAYSSKHISLSSLGQDLGVRGNAELFISTPTRSAHPLITSSSTSQPIQDTLEAASLSLKKATAPQRVPRLFLCLPTSLFRCNWYCTMSSAPTARSVPPPSSQEIARKLSVHSAAKPIKVIAQATSIVRFGTHCRHCRSPLCQQHPSLEPSPTPTLWCRQNLCPLHLSTRLWGPYTVWGSFRNHSCSL